MASRFRSVLAGQVPVWLVAFVPTVYLALSGGGYDEIVRSEVGLLFWWALLLGVLAGVLPRTGTPRGPWLALIPLTGFFAWTWIATGWSSSQELTLLEVGRVAVYIAPFLLAACAVGRRGARALLAGIAAGIAVVCTLAVLSKLVPSWFAADPTARLYATGRLRYPFDYSDGVGEFAALGLPLLLYLGSSARTIWARCLSAGALPVVVLCLGLTVSRGGILAAAVGVALFLALADDRLPRLLTTLLGLGATAVLVVMLAHRQALIDQLQIAPAQQRHSMLLALVVVSVATALAQGGLALAGAYWARPTWTKPSRRFARGVGAGMALGLVAGISVLFATGAAQRLWEQFKEPSLPASSTSYFRLFSLAGSHRYQYWQVAVHAFQSDPLRGIGPGTFRFYWAAHNHLGEYVLNAHSLWMETLAETGIVGLALLAGFFLLVLVGGAARAMRAPSELRLLQAAAVACVGAFCAAAAFDWVWQIGVVPMVAMALAAVALAGDRRGAIPGARLRAIRAPIPGRLRGPAGSPRPPLLGRLGLIAGSLVALWAISVPLATTITIRRSQEAAHRGDLRAALRYATAAARMEPGAASPRLEQALVLEQQRDVPGAQRAIVLAERREPTDWEIWLVASRIATEADRPQLALADYLRARSLNPTSPLFRR